MRWGLWVLHLGNSLALETRHFCNPGPPAPVLAKSELLTSCKSQDQISLFARMLRVEHLKEKKSALKGAPKALLVRGLLCGLVLSELEKPLQKLGRVESFLCELLQLHESLCLEKPLWQLR